MTFRLISALCSCIMLYACGWEIEKTSPLAENLILVDSVTFEMDFSFMPQHTAQFEDAELNQTLVYFADLTTQKKVAIYRMNGELYYEIDLSKAINFLNNSVQELEVVSLDTVLLLSTTTNALAYVNRKGEVWRKVDLDQELGFNSDSLQAYEFQVSLMNSAGIINKKDLLLYVSTLLKKNYNDPYDWVLANKVHQWKSKQFMRIYDVFSDSMSYQLGGKLLQSISPNDSNAMIIDIFNFYNITSDAVYITSLFSNKLFILDPTEMEITGSYEIESEYTDFGIPLYSSSTKVENKEKYPKVSAGLRERGLLDRVYYNQSKEHYYITGRIDKSREHSDKWLLLILNKNFEMIKEHLMELKEWMGLIWVTERGFFIRKKTNQDSYHKQEVKMYELTY